MAETLSEQLADYRASWRARVPADRQALMDQHVAHLAASGIERGAKQVGDRAPAIRLRDQRGEDFDIAVLLTKGPVVVKPSIGAAGAPSAIWNSKPIRPRYPGLRRPERAWWRSALKSLMIPPAPPKRTR